MAPACSLRAGVPRLGGRRGEYLVPIMPDRINLLAVMATILGAATALAADFKVIANPSVSASTVSSEELKGIFLITRTSLGDGSHVEPVLEKSGAVHETCLKQYLGKPIPPYRLITATCYSPEKGRCPKSCLPTLKWSPTWQEPRGDRICQFRDEHGRCQDSGS